MSIDYLYNAVARGIVVPANQCLHDANLIRQARQITEILFHRVGSVVNFL
jgi:hypothetical protein